MNRKQLFGFTLIEILLALGLTALLMGLLSTGVYVVSRDWNENSTVLDQSLDETLALLQIDRAIHGAFPHSYMDENSLAKLIYFVGEEDYLSWVSTVSPQRAPGLTAWELFSDDEGVHLVLAPAYSDFPGERLEQGSAVLILPGYSASFSYLYEDTDESRRWREDWYADETQSLPLAVYIKFSPLDDDDGRIEDREILARIASNEHRSLRPNSLQNRL